MTQSDILEKEETRTVPPEDGDHDRLSHYVEKDELMRAMVEGTVASALCGKMWVPTRDGMRFPICPECQEAYNALAPD